MAIKLEINGDGKGWSEWLRVAYAVHAKRSKVAPARLGINV